MTRRILNVAWAIVMVLVLIVAILFIANSIVTILSVSKTLMAGEVVNSTNDVAEFFMNQSASTRILLLIGAVLAIPTSLVGAIGWGVAFKKMFTPEYDEVSVEYGQGIDN